ncbi:MAG TPA: hypothetical protein DER05_01035 [Lutibacter sp.]|nr:hypothetical protein [Lutibacter sp.]
MMLNIIGGSYIENCVDPFSSELYGSGLRASAALSNKGFKINFQSCICEKFKGLALLKSKTFGYSCNYTIIPQTVEFDYYHPLSVPISSFNQVSKICSIDNNREGDFLYYGMAESNAQINGNYVVYDPQNHINFKDTGSTSKHLAVILNKNEALLLSKGGSDDLTTIGKNLLISENADVIVIKNGVHGALVFENHEIFEIPVFYTNYVWPIGSGDIFSAVFAWKWIIEKESAFNAAFYASKNTAQYCLSKHLPVVLDPQGSLHPLEIKSRTKSIYLAGPFFSISERWLINELRNILINFGNKVFSPFHDVGIIHSGYINEQATNIASKDLEGIIKCDTVLAVINGLDVGTFFEIGYAKSLNKKVVILAQDIKEKDLTMLIGTECEITDDFSTAIYKASW